MAKEQLNPLKEFFRQKQEKAKPADIDWAGKRDGYIQAVGRLYDTIEKEYLATANDVVRIDRSQSKAMHEPYIGNYSIPEMTLAVGDERVVFSPKGLNVVGAAGRVDVRGDRGEATIVRQPEENWSLVLSRSPHLQLVELTDATFLDMMRRVMR